MNVEWLNWSNPVALWWIFLVSVSCCNIIFWAWSFYYLRRYRAHENDILVRSLIYLAAGYVFVCAFRSILPRADVQRICLFDTWWSSVLVGRTVATIGELCFVAQWAIVLNRISKFANSISVNRISYLIFPLIFIAEIFSWYSVITTHYLGNSCEESLWAITYGLILICLILLLPKFRGALKYAVLVSIVGCFLYILFMVTVDVPMYLGRLKADQESGKRLLGLVEGFQDLNSRWIVTHDIEQWKTEIPWMSLYFSAAVWVSLALCYVPLTKTRLSRYLSHNSKSN